MKVLEGITKVSFVSFFASHIIFTIIIDGQVLFPQSWFPQPLRDMLALHVNSVNDPIMATPKSRPWFVALVLCEFAFQLPYFFAAVHQMTTTPKGGRYPRWFQTSSMLYGAHTATSLVPILATLAANPDATQMERMLAISVYSPYLIFPLWILYLAVQDDIVSTSTAAGKKKS
mmetsp:Transcript_9511/g.25834  ORF Transcript_9511/g.25834 Transcript_9511/m.25834 type:complete len:173 (-) Transcript_9511:1069-1587(-)